ncbi:MAG: hypothetical protein ACOY3X_07855 [Pseudomonadota bacterium]
MKHHRLGLLAAAIAAVSLVGCEDDDNGPRSLKVTTANAPYVAADGAALIEGAMDVDDEGSPDEIIPAGVTVTGGEGRKIPGLTFIKLGELVREDQQNGELAALVSSALPVGVVTEGTEVDCETSGSYIYYNTASTWGITYNNCVSEYSGDTYESRYTLNGTATGDYDGAGYGGWNADYEGLRSTYASTYQEGEYGGSYSGSYQIDGHFEYYYDYGGYGGSYASHYVADDLVVKYKYKATGDAVEESDEFENAAGTITYDAYEFMFYNYGGYWYWQGNLQATDSERGIWTITTPSPFGIDYCDEQVVGSIRYTGRLAEEHHEESPAGRSNILVISGNGTGTVSYTLYENDGTTVISDEDHDWFDYSYPYCY